MSRERWLNQKKYTKDDERKLRQELDEREAQRQKSYSKEDEKKIKEEIDRTTETNKQQKSEDKKK